MTAEVAADLALVALVRGERLLVGFAQGRARLPEVPERWPDTADLCAAVNSPNAVPVIPARLVARNPQRALHILVEQGVGSATQDASAASAASVPALPGLADATWLDASEPGALDALADPDLAAALRAGLDELHGRAEISPIRPDWFRLGWLAEADAWINDQLRALGHTRTGASTVVQMWGLSAVLRVPVASGELYFKAACEWFRAEPALTAAIAELAPHVVTAALAVDRERSWMLMTALPGTHEDHGDAVAEVATLAAETMARIQLGSLAYLDALRAAGCPDRTLEPTLAGLAEVLATSPELDDLRRERPHALAEAHERLVADVRAFWDCGLPATLAHGDLHTGNVAFDATAPPERRVVIFDWSDACVTHPFLDGWHVARSAGADVQADVVAAFAAIWRQAYPEADINRALDLAPTVNKAFQLVTYHGIATACEPVSSWQLGGIIAATVTEWIADAG